MSLYILLDAELTLRDVVVYVRAVVGGHFIFGLESRVVFLFGRGQNRDFLG